MKEKSIKYFTSGLIFLIPIFILVQIVKSASWFVTGFIDLPLYWAFPISVLFIGLLGFFGQNIFKKQLKKKFIKASQKKTLWGNIAKLFTNFDRISDRAQKAFSNPVLYKVDDGIYKLGFITDTDINMLGSDLESTNKIKNEADPAPGSIWVFSPYPINFSGELVLVESRKIKKIQRQDSESIPLFILSGGILNNEQYDQESK